MADLRIKCPSCTKGIVLENCPEVPVLPEALAWANGCPHCKRPFLVARMAEGLQAFEFTRTGDLDRVQVRSKAFAKAARKAIAS